MKRIPSRNLATSWKQYALKSFLGGRPCRGCCCSSSSLILDLTYWEYIPQAIIGVKKLKSTKAYTGILSLLYHFSYCSWHFPWMSSWWSVFASQWNRGSLFSMSKKTLDKTTPSTSQKTFAVKLNLLTVLGARSSLGDSMMYFWVQSKLSGALG